MVENKEQGDNWVQNRCPRDCPFNDRLADRSDRYCSFAIYADMLEPGRFTRTTIDDSGEINYHQYPDCDVYPRFKGLDKVVLETKRRRMSEHKVGLPSSPDVAVTGHKHPATQKHHGEF